MSVLSHWFIPSLLPLHLVRTSNSNMLVDNPAAEDLKLAMPSTWSAGLLNDAGLEHLIKEEVQLHIGQANEPLEKLRTHLGHKSVLFWMTFWSSSLVRTDTRSKQDIRRVGLKINQDVWSYHQAWDASGRGLGKRVRKALEHWWMSPVIKVTLCLSMIEENYAACMLLIKRGPMTSLRSTRKYC